MDGKIRQYVCFSKAPQKYLLGKVSLQKMYLTYVGIKMEMLLPRIVLGSLFFVMQFLLQTSVADGEYENALYGIWLKITS